MASNSMGVLWIYLRYLPNMFVSYKSIYKLHHIPMDISTETYLYLPITGNILIQCRSSKHLLLAL